MPRTKRDMVIAVCPVAPAHVIPDRDKDGKSGAGDENSDNVGFAAPGADGLDFESPNVLVAIANSVDNLVKTSLKGVASELLFRP
jgi:hypothetical protein